MSDKPPAILVVGLGNPGARYALTRHNIGFLFVERVLEIWGQREKLVRKSAWEAEYASLVHDGRTIHVLRPLTYMNLSGGPVATVAGFYKLPPESLFVCCDDVNLPFGAVRIRAGGGAGGHRGLLSIIERLGHQGFARMRMGVGGGTPGRDLTGFVLDEFSRDEHGKLGAILDHGVKALETTISRGIGVAMSQFNGDVLSPRPEGGGAVSSPPPKPDA